MFVSACLVCRIIKLINDIFKSRANVTEGKHWHQKDLEIPLVSPLVDYENSNKLLRFVFHFKNGSHKQLNYVGQMFAFEMKQAEIWHCKMLVIVSYYCY